MGASPSPGKKFKDQTVNEWITYYPFVNFLKEESDSPTEVLEQVQELVLERIWAVRNHIKSKPHVLCPACHGVGRQPLWMDQVASLSLLHSTVTPICV